LRIPSGPAVTLVAGLFYGGSVLFGRVGGIVWQAFPGHHLEA
jgi:zinc/manganese transport system permease protein